MITVQNAQVQNRHTGTVVTVQMSRYSAGIMARKPECKGTEQAHEYLGNRPEYPDTVQAVWYCGGTRLKCPGTVQAYWYRGNRPDCPGTAEAHWYRGTRPECQGTVQAHWYRGNRPECPRYSTGTLVLW